MNDVMFSIIIPVYQSRKFLRKTVEDTLKQTYKNFEIILINDGSDDGSEEICNKLSKEYKCIKVIHQPNKGVSAARNIGIKNSIGKYILFLDSDDRLEINALSMLAKVIEEYNIDLVMFDFVWCRNNNNLVASANISEGVFNKNQIVELFWSTYECCIAHNVGTKLYKKEIIKKYNIEFNENYSIFEDIMFCIDYLSKCNTVFYLKTPFYYYYIHQNGSLSSSYKKKFLDAHDMLFSKIKGLLNENNEFDIYVNKFYKYYMSSLSGIIDNECRHYDKNATTLIKDIVKNDNVINAKQYVTGKNLKQKILFNLIWKRQVELIKILIDFKIKVRSILIH